ncbi:MAG TPA: hypothetical protein VHC50_06050 [Puia sp.]|nr:hypothetical protein [Puia sp.]
MFAGAAMSDGRVHEKQGMSYTAAVVFSFLAIFIACTGLLALIAFGQTAHQGTS